MSEAVPGAHRASSATATVAWSTRVLALAALCTVLKLWIALRTYGTDDVRYWTGFLRGVAQHGPIGVYGVQGFEAPYNHPPLIGWVLLVFSKLHEAGLSIPFLIRAPASVADLFSSVLVFRLLRQVSSERQAGVMACVFATSPLLFVISGFHGNTDPVFILFVLTAGYAIIRERGTLAGVAAGLAISVKLTPVVMMPLLLILAVRRGRSVWTGFLAGGGGVFALVWLPAFVLRRHEVTSQVLNYSGAGPRQWGLSQIARWLGAPESGIFQEGDHLRFLSVALAALAPACIALVRPNHDVRLLGLPLCLFLWLSPSFGYQYLTWALAPAFLLAPLLPAALYSSVAGLTAVLVYSGWNDAPPWDWYEARSTPTPEALLPLLALTWISLGLVCLSVIRLVREGPTAAAVSKRARPPSTSAPKEPSDVPY